MSKVKNGDMIRCITSLMGDCFMVGCDYQVDKVDSDGFVYCYNDSGELCAVDFPHDPDYGKFEKVS